MALWLVHDCPRAWSKLHRGRGGGCDPATGQHRVNLDEGPAPCVLADGICGAKRTEVWLEDDDVRVKVVHDTAWPGNSCGEPHDVTDCPACTVTIGTASAANASHWRVEIDEGEPPAPPLQKELPGMPAAPPKPMPYRVPSMAEVEAVPWNGLVVASTFSGGGGSCLGYRMAGFRVAWANEFVPAAQDTYRANSPGTVLDPRDIRDIEAAEILEAIGMERGQLDLLDGSPPCQSFSTAGKREKGWGKVSAHGDGSNQRSDDLFYEYARLLEGLQPRCFIAENVSGLVKGVAKGYFLRIMERLRGAGYRVQARLVDAQWCGVPQQRVRLIIQGVRSDLPAEHAWPEPLPYRYTVREALADITPGLMAQTVGNEAFEPVMGSPDEPHPTILAGGARTSGEVIVAQLRKTHDFEEIADTIDAPSATISTKVGGRTSGEVLVYSPDRRSRKRNGPLGQDLTDEPMPTVTALGLGNGYRVDVEPVEDEAWLRGRSGEVADGLRPGESPEGSYFSMRRLEPDAPAGTVQASEGTMPSTNQVHPLERRRLSIAELRRICSFPDDFVLTGSYGEQWARLGNSVPPLMMARIASAVRDGPLRAP